MKRILNPPLKEKEILLKEIHHRVKNNLQVISSLLGLQSSKLDKKEKRYIKESQNRIRSIALVHEKLYQSENLSEIDIQELLKSLVNDIQQAYSLNKTVQFQFDVDTLKISVDMAIPCALIINELIINAIQHGFKKQKDKRIDVHFKSTNKTYMFSVIDNGIGLPDHIDVENVKSLGLTLVTALTDQLSGVLTVKRNKGTSVSVEFAQK